jgi:pimeloyl-ACP methyl ester carboxylesterase
MRWLLVLPVVLCLLPAAGSLYQYVGALRDRQRFLGQGRRVKIAAGDWMYLCERGSDGPAIIFEAGIGATSQNWHGLQQDLVGVARTVAYDRIGLGWSSTGRCTERTPSNIAHELHEMLQAARIAPPYLMVGHSFGGLVVRRFAAEYPQEVSGVVLVDPMRPEEWPPLNEAARPMLNRAIRLLSIGVPLAWIGVARWIATSMLCRSGRTARAISRLAGRGGAHLLGRLTSELDKMPRTVWPVVAAHWSNPHFYRGMVAHLQAVPASVREMQDAAPIDRAPVTVLTPHSSQLSPLALSRIGVHTRQIVARGSGHWIHLDEPELVRGTIQAMMEESGLSSSSPRYLYSGLAAADAVDDPEGVSDGAPAETGFAAGV